jgi:hypothetical protein
LRKEFLFLSRKRRVSFRIDNFAFLSSSPAFPVKIDVFPGKNLVFLLKTIIFLDKKHVSLKISLVVPKMRKVTRNESLIILTNPF